MDDYTPIISGWPAVPSGLKSGESGSEPAAGRC